jgi:hypothetical protein
MESAVLEVHLPVTPRPAILDSLKGCQGFKHILGSVRLPAREWCFRQRHLQPCSFTSKGRGLILHSPEEAYHKQIALALACSNVVRVSD